MIEKLQIRGFRVHKKLDLNFGPGVNYIVGRNYAGKSTVLRAIEWVARNKPAGTSVINWDSSKATVRLFIDGKKITKKRSQSINTYRLDKKKKLTAFGTNVPDDIQKAIGLSEINFQGQHDAPFWFCKTAGEVSRQLNAIVDLDIIDSTLANLSKSLNKHKIIAGVIEENVTKIKAKNESLVYVDIMDGNFKNVESTEKLWGAANQRCTALSDLVARVQKQKRAAKAFRILHVLGKDVVATHKKYLQLYGQKVILQCMMTDIKKQQTIIKRRPPSFALIEKQKQKQRNIIEKITKLENIVRAIEWREEKERTLKQEVVECQTKLKKVSVGKCPMCGKML